MEDNFIKAVNPIMGCDYPDPDVIRVGKTYYMVSTTMYFMPGCPILRSYDLANWEVVSYVYDRLEDNDAHSLSDGRNIYGCGMWAASLRYHNGTFYVCFVANDTHKTYLFTTQDIEGSWERHEIEGFYHDCSLLFDDGRVYIVSGNSEIRLTELRPDLSGPLAGGLDRVILRDERDIPLGYEGSHLYKLWGRYYLFTIHAAERGKFFRTEACFAADSLEGEFKGGDIVRDDLGFFGNGVAQGGVVDTPDGKWYLFLFQDRGAAGRIPVLVPMRWTDGFPQVDRVPRTLCLKSTNPGHVYEPLWGSDDFCYKAGERLKSFWQWNHNPDAALVSAGGGKLAITTDRLSLHVCQAKNTLTQRSAYPRCAAEVTADASLLREGDYVGIAALQSNYGAIALTVREGRTALVVLGRKKPDGEDARPADLRFDVEPPVEYLCILLAESGARLGIRLDFTDLRDEAEFYYYSGGKKCETDIRHKLYFWLDYFTGCRFALFVYSTRTAGGTGVFSDFRYLLPQSESGAANQSESSAANRSESSAANLLTKQE